MDKAQFLDDQSEDAKAAMRAALKDAKIDIFRSVDPHLWAKSHPWKTVAAAAAAGFAAGLVLQGPSAESDETPAPEPSKMGRLMVRFLKRSIRVAAAAAQPLIEGLLAAHAASTNGASHPDSDGPNPSQPSQPPDSDPPSPA
jgi:hypothetical protein